MGQFDSGSILVGVDEDARMMFESEYFGLTVAVEALPNAMEDDDSIVCRSVVDEAEVRLRAIRQLVEMLHGAVGS